MERTTCPKAAVTPFSGEMLGLFLHWERGVMPFPGALYEQPQIVIEAMNLVGLVRAGLKRN